MGLKPWEFDRLESVHDLNAMLRHEIHRRQATEDLFGHLRLAVYLANGVTFPASPGPPKPGTPTFEKLMGRAPVPFMPGMPRPALEEEAEISDAAARAMAMVSVAGVKRTKGRGTTTRPPPAPEAPSG